MGLLFGTFENVSIDDKGRLSLPASIRKAMSEAADNTLMIIQGTEGCLFAYPLDTWLVFWDGLKKLSHTRENTRLIRRIIGNLKEARLDGQGRLTLTQKLKDLGMIRHDVTLVGNGEKLEIWDSGAWRQQLVSAEQSGVYDEDYYRAQSEIDRMRHDG